MRILNVLCQAKFNDEGELVLLHTREENGYEPVPSTHDTILKAATYVGEKNRQSERIHKAGYKKGTEFTINIKTLVNE